MRRTGSRGSIAAIRPRFGGCGRGLQEGADHLVGGVGLFLLLFFFVLLEDAIYVLDGFAVGRDTFVLVDRAGAGVVGGDRFRDLVRIVFVFEEQVAEVACAGFHVLHGVVRIDV